MNTFDAMLDDAGRRFNVDPRIVKARMMLESGGNPNVGASLPNDPDSPTGLMQMRPSTARQYGADPRDVKQAIDAATQYTREGLDKTGSVEGSFAYYHGGPDTKQWGPKTAQYVQKGMALLPQTQVNAQMADAPQKSPGELLFEQMGQAAKAPAANAAKSPGELLFEQMGQAAQKAAPAEPAPPPATTTASEMFSGYGGGISSGNIDPAQITNPQAPTPQPLPGQMRTPAPPSIPTGAVANAAAGAIEGGAGGVNAIADPFGNLVGKPLATVYLAARHALAPVLGYKDLPPEVQNYILGDQTPQIGNKLAGVVGGALNAPQPEQIVAATPGEQVLRAATQGAASGAGMGGPLLTAAMASGGALGQVANNLAPAPYGPVAGLAGNLVGAGAVAGGFSRPGNKLAPAAEQPRPATPEYAAVAGDTGEGTFGPKSGGAAATPHELTTMTPAQEASYRKSAEGSKLVEPQMPGEQDATQYVPGSTPTRAAILQDPIEARAENQTRSQNPLVFKAQDAQNNLARTSHFDQQAGNPMVTQALRDDLDAKFADQRASVFGNAKPVDVAPVIAEGEKILNGPTGRRGAVETGVTNAISRLTGRDGALVTDPETLYSVRQHINDLIGGKAGADTAQAKLAQKELIQLRDTLDNTIEGGAPGFKQYLSDYSEAVKPIEAQQFLQDHRASLFDAASVMTPAKMQNFMKSIVDLRGARAPNAAKSLTQEQMNELWNIRNDLRREDAMQRLARAPGNGSATQQNLWDRAKGLGGAGLEAAAHGAAALVTGGNPIANFAVRAGTNAITEGRAAKALQRNTQNALSHGIPLRRPGD